MTDQICQCCGQTLPVLAPFGLRLTAGERRIFERVARAGPHGIHVSELLDYVFAEDIDGGPLWAAKSLHTRIHYLNRKLRTKNKIISCRSRHANYALRDLSTGNPFLWVPPKIQRELRA